MKLLYFTRYFSQGYGVSLVIKEQIKQLSLQTNHEIFVAANDIDVRFAKDIQVIKIDTSEQSTFHTINTLKPVAVLVHTPPFFEYVANYQQWPIIKIAYDHGEPFPSFFDTGEMRQRQQLETSKRSAICNFHVHISISNFIKELSGIENSFVIYNGCEHIEDEQTEMVNTNVHNFLGLPEEIFIISCLSRIGAGEFHYKGLDALIEIKKRLGLDKVAFLLIGKIAQGGYEIVNRMKKEGFYIASDVDDRTKRDLIKTSNLFLSTSFWEGFNLPLVEAQRLGVLSACFSTGAHPEVCPFHFGNVNELVEFIEAIYRDERLRLKFADSCKNFVKQRFSWRANASALNNILVNMFDRNEKGRLNTIKTYSKAENKILAFHEKDKEVLIEHIKRVNLEGKVEEGLITGTYKIIVNQKAKWLVSIIIPNRDCKELLSNCLRSIKDKTNYSYVEIIIVENGSTDPETFRLYEELSLSKQAKIITWENPFNYSAINNYGVKHSNGEMFLFLNNDTEVINKDWIERLMDYATRGDVGAVGAKLYYPDNTIQHASVIIGIKDIAGHSHRFFPRDADGYFGRLKIPHNVSAVTGACLMTRRDVFQEIGGFDENLPVAFNDIDYCLRLREKSYLIVWTPYAELYHYESKSRGHYDDRANPERFQREYNYFKNRWSKVLDAGDPYYNPNLTKESEDFSLQTKTPSR